MESRPNSIDSLLEELAGFVEAWRDDAALRRGDSNRTFDFSAEAYDECADEIEALLGRYKGGEPPQPKCGRCGDTKFIALSREPCSTAETECPDCNASA